jgi:lysozyme
MIPTDKERWREIARVAAAARISDIPMQISEEGLMLIMEFEGCEFKAYECQGNVWTLGFGHTADVQEGDTCTEEQAIHWLSEDVQYFEEGVWRLIEREDMTQGEFDALVSFAYNVGLDEDEDTQAEGLGDSTLLRLYNEGDTQGAADEFAKWTKAGGKVSAGLVRRREAERALFLS